MKLLLIVIHFPLLTLSQQLSNPKVFINNTEKAFVVSGVGAGATQATNNATANGQVAIDWNVPFNLQSTGKNKKESLTSVFKNNPANNTNIPSNNKLLNINKVAYTHLDNQFMMGARYNNMYNMGKDSTSKYMLMWFADAQTNLISFKDSSSNTQAVRTFYTTLGLQFGYFSKFDFGVSGICISPQLHYLSITDEVPEQKQWQKMNGSMQQVATKFVGPGTKLIVYLNDFAFFLEMRKMYTLGNKHLQVSGLTGFTLFSVGAIGTGMLLNNKGK